QYIEQPDDYFGGVVATPNPANLSLVSFGGVDPTNGYGYSGPADPNAKYWSVQPGDCLEVLGTGLTHPIVGYFNASTVVVAPPLPYLISTPTPNYRIIRAPRAVGDETLKLPEGTIIDLQTN